MEQPLGDGGKEKLHFHRKEPLSDGSGRRCHLLWLVVSGEKEERKWRMEEDKKKHKLWGKSGLYLL